MNDAYYGSRGEDFKKIIIDLLKKGNLKQKYIDVLTNTNSMKEYGNAFTTSNIDNVNNYERYEQIGDVTANKFIVWYIYRRFPQLDCTGGVKVVARVRINYGAKQFFGQLGEQLGFWPFISALEDGQNPKPYYRSRNKKDLLEDCLEAFIGCTEKLLDDEFRPGVGYGIIYDILSRIFDEIPISLKYEDLYDSKTRLKEVFDSFKVLGSWHFETTRREIEGGYNTAYTNLYMVPNKRVLTKVDLMTVPGPGWVKIGVGEANKKGDSQQKAAESGLVFLKNKGYFKENPVEYNIFCNFK